MDFYESLEPILRFEDIYDARYFVDVPDDYVVLISDIRGSTQAVKSGKIKQVNMIGASVIALVSNGTRQYNTMSVFGGDGATIILSQTQFDSLKKQFVGLIRLARDEFGIELRIGAVSAATLRREGCKVLIAKHQVSETTCLAQLAGDGISRAEYLIKSNSAEAISLSYDDDFSVPNLTGLSCRMDVFKNSHGLVLSMILKAQGSESEGWVRKDLLAEIKNILNGDFSASNPVTEKKISWKWLPATMSSEVKLNSGSVLKNIKVILNALVANFLLMNNVSLGGFVPSRYKAELPMQSDFKKYDDALRFVIDCTEQQKDSILKILEEAYQAKKIFYGFHISDAAVVTCLTESAATGNHVHFVDGNGGGYSLASIQLKEQIKKAKEI